MRKVIFLMHLSLDGLVAGPNGEMDWIVYTQELESYVHELHNSTDAAIYGRGTYDMMHGYWPTVLSNPESSAGDKNHARWYENATKIVFSRKLEKIEGDKTVLIRDNIVEEMTKIKQQPGKNLWLLGSPTLAQTFMQLGLIDEYWLNVNPIILGNGKPLYGNLKDKINLKLIEAKTIPGGVVGLRYEPVKA